MKETSANTTGTENNRKRRVIAAGYREGFSGISALLLPEEPAESVHVYHQFVIRVKAGRRNELAEFLKSRMIGTAVHYPEPVPCQKAFRSVPQIVSLENTLTVNSEILSLPMYPELTRSEVQEIIAAVRSFFA